MKQIVVSIAAAMAISGGAQAEQRHALHGLFCNTEAQIEQTLAHMRGGVPPQFAARMVNEHMVVCVYADRIQYVITGPANIGQALLRGVMLVKYEATLVGVLVGGNLRPVEPPARIFFVSGDRLPGAVAIRGT